MLYMYVYYIHCTSVHVTVTHTHTLASHMLEINTYILACLELASVLGIDHRLFVFVWNRSNWPTP